MANEITLTASLTANKNGAGATGNFSGTLDMTGTEMTAAVQSLTTSNAALLVGGVDQLEAVLIRNLSVTPGENISVALDSSHTQVVSVIKPGKGVLLSGLAAAALNVKSAAGAPDIFVVSVES